jgi:hypothetical protein
MSRNKQQIVVRPETMERIDTFEKANAFIKPYIREGYAF